MQTNVPEAYLDTIDPMRQTHDVLLRKLQASNIAVADFPSTLPQANPAGASAAKAYPIQGILKYHGMSDWRWRTTFLPSISVNNDAAYSITAVEFDASLTEDEAFINGNKAEGRDLERVQQILDYVREIGRMSTPARVRSRNVTKAVKVGKGLGTSASASAALATAALSAAFGEQIVDNTRFISCAARLLAGSGGRSAAGGISLWLSYPGISHADSFSVRLDNHDQLADMRLITVPIDSRIGLKTEIAHRDAPDSPFYKPWMDGREAETIECIDAVQAGDWKVVGQLAELDSIRLHGVTMSGSRENKIFAWEPENIGLFRMCNELRSSGVPVYFSTDTGPTVVLITHKDYADAVVSAVKSIDASYEVLVGGLAGPSELVSMDEADLIL